MIHRALVFLSLFCCAFVVMSFVLFAHDQIAGASKHQQNELIVAGPAMHSAPAKSHGTGQPRRFIDSVAHRLTSPFGSIVHSANTWATHGVPAVLALLVYGFGLSFLARVARPAL